MSKFKDRKLLRTNDHSTKRIAAHPGTRDRIDVHSKWSVRRLLRGSRTGPAYVEIRFPNEAGEIVRLPFPISDLRHERKLLDLVLSYVPEFPEGVGRTNASRHRFIQNLAQASPLEVVPERTGFLEKDTFVTHSDIIGAAGRRKRRPRLPGADDQLFVDVRGRAKKARVVLQLARRSTYLAFSFGVALAAPLPSYVKLLREGKRSDRCG